MKDDLSTLMYNVSDNAKILTSRCFKSFIKEDNTIIKWNHTITPMKKSTWEGLFDRHQERIEKSCSTFRSPRNMTQELVNSWHYLSGKYNKDYTLKVNYIGIKDIKNKDGLYEAIKN